MSFFIQDWKALLDAAMRQMFHADHAFKTLTYSQAKPLIEARFKSMSVAEFTAFVDQRNIGLNQIKSA